MSFLVFKIQIIAFNYGILHGKIVYRFFLLSEISLILEDKVYFPLYCMLINAKVMFHSGCRTNVVQSLLARESLSEQLQYLGILRHEQRVEHIDELEKCFKFC